MVTEVDVSSLEEFAGEMTSLSSELGSGIAALLRSTAVDIEEEVSVVIAAATPSAENPTDLPPPYDGSYADLGEYTNALMESTRGESVIVGESIMTQIRQTATKDDHPIADWVIHGTAGGLTGRIVGNPALRTPWGPRAWVRGARSNDYPDREDGRIMTVLDLIGDQFGDEAAAFLMGGRL